MKRPWLEAAGATLVLVALSAAGSWLQARLNLFMPGPVVGMVAYAVLLLATPWLNWTLPAARLLASWLGALIVPALVGAVLLGSTLARGGWRLAFVLVASTALTGLATATLFRALGGKA